MNDLQEMQQYSKGFLDKKEGKWGLVIGIAALGAAGYALLSNLPWFIALLTNVITAGALLGVIIVAVAVIWDGRLPAALWYLYQNGITRALQAMWRSDPVSIAWSYVFSLRKYREKMQAMIAQLKGQINSLVLLIKENKQEIEKNLAGARKAKEIGKQAEFLLRSRKVGRKNESNVKYEDALATLDKMYKTAVRMDEVAELLIEDTADQIRERTTMYNSMRSAASVFSAFKSIMKGDKNKKFIFDGAMEFMQEDIANKVGEIESFMDMSKKFLDGVDIDNAIFEEQGEKMIEQWATGSKLLGDDTKKELSFAGIKAGKKSTSAYAKLLNDD